MTARWPGRAAYLGAVALVTAAIAHLGAVLATPFHSAGDAYARIASEAGDAAFKTVLPPEPGRAPFADPAMVAGACLFDLSAGAASVTLETGDAPFAVLSVRGRHGRMIAAVTSRSATRGRLALSLVPSAPAQRPAAPPDEIRVETGETTGFVLAEALVPTPSQHDLAEAVVRTLVCRRR